MMASNVSFVYLKSMANYVFYQIQHSTIEQMKEKVKKVMTES